MNSEIAALICCMFAPLFVSALVVGIMDIIKESRKYE
jgi:hypothetical protein